MNANRKRTLTISAAALFTIGCVIAFNLFNLRPNEAQAYLNLARLYLQSNQVALGVAAMEDALKVEPAHPMALTTLVINAIDTKSQTQADSLLNRIYHQPRIDAQTIAKITGRYQTQFGKAP